MNELSDKKLTRNDEIILERYGAYDKDASNFRTKHYLSVCQKVNIIMNKTKYMPSLSDILRFVEAYCDVFDIDESSVYSVLISEHGNDSISYQPNTRSFNLSAPCTHSHFMASTDKATELETMYNYAYFTWRAYIDGKRSGRK